MCNHNWIDVQFHERTVNYRKQTMALYKSNRFICKNVWKLKILNTLNKVPIKGLDKMFKNETGEKKKYTTHTHTQLV